VKKILLGAALAALTLVPAAAASRAHTVKLALVPLPKSAIGAAASSFSLAHDSGRVSNANAAAHTPDGTPKTFKKLGRLTGYGLEYGNAFTGAAGVTDVRTSIEQYKTASGARRALAFWKKEDAKLSELDNPGFSVTSVPVQVPAPAPGTSHFAYLTSYSASNIVPVSGIDEQIADGRYVLDVIVTAGTASLAETLAPKLAGKLDARLRLARKGHLRAKPVKLTKQKAGRPPGGPDLSVLALRKSDLVGEATVSKGYLIDPAAISDYSVFMLPAGQFDALDQEIEWYPVANEASFFADFENAAALTQSGTTALDLSSLGDGAQGSVTTGTSFSQGQVFFSSGHLAEFIFMGSAGSVDNADVTSVAQAAANRIDAAGLGS
jgi:opacity protein-like surface antigen